MGVLGCCLCLYLKISPTYRHLWECSQVFLYCGLPPKYYIRNKSHEDSEGLSVGSVIRRIDTPSILFFLGILLAVAGLQTTGILLDFAHIIDHSLGSIYLINLSIGLLSAIVDNVPLVAGAMGMYSLDTYPQDHHFWELLAYCAGTGGSVSDHRIGCRCCHDGYFADRLYLVFEKDQSTGSLWLSWGFAFYLPGFSLIWYSIETTYSNFYVINQLQYDQ